MESLKFLNKLILLVLIPVVVLITGCATTAQKSMALKFDNPPKSNKINSLALFTLQMENHLKPSHKPYAQILNISSIDKKFSCNFGLDKPINSEENSFNYYLVSVELPPGKYTIGNIAGYSSSFLSGQFKFLVNATIEIPSESIIYCGNLSMANRKRKKGEPRSGKIFPLLNQAESGFYSGTFDTVISNKYDEDVESFQRTFPWLRNKEVKTILMTMIQ